MKKPSGVEAFWLQFGGKVAKYYHVSEPCWDEIKEKDNLVTGSIEEAMGSTREFCLDCERTVRHGSNNR